MKLPRKFLALALALAVTAISLAGCVTVPVTPESVTAAKKVPQEERDALLQRWKQAVELCNQFLRSPHRKTLPESRVEFTPKGMRFISDTNQFPVHVRCSWWGDILILASMSAQERSDGFVVGSVKPHRHRAVDNSLFRSPGRGFYGSAAVASLILHEITHTHYELGTVSFWKGAGYYLEAVFLLRYRNHTKERLPYKTNDEFMRFIMDVNSGKPPKGTRPAHRAGSVRFRWDSREAWESDSGQWIHGTRSRLKPAILPA